MQRLLGHWEVSKLRNLQLMRKKQIRLRLPPDDVILLNHDPLTLWNIQKLND